MKLNKIKKKSFIFLIISSITIISFLMNSIPGYASDSEYSIAINKGSEILKVAKYDKKDWEEILGGVIDPDDWLGGDSDEVGARNKITLRGISDYKWKAYDVLLLVFDVLDYIPDKYLPAIIPYFTEDSINAIFPENYKVWEILCVKWDFKTGEFDEDPDDNEILIPILKDPHDYRNILDLYNEWVLYINATMVLLNLEPYPSLDGDTFLWNLILKEEFMIAQPFNQYLEEVVDALDCKDIEAKRTKLFFTRVEEEEYNVEFSFSEQGTISKIVVFDDGDDVIYEITRDDSNIVILISIGVFLSIMTGVIYILIRKIKRKSI